MIRNRKRGQSTLEVVVLIVVVSVAVILMQKYIKRAVQGKLKSGAEQIGDPWTYQASPTTVVLEKNTTVQANMVDDTNTTGETVTKYQKLVQKGYVKTNVEQLSNTELEKVW